MTNNLIYPCFWFDNNAAEAAAFYAATFEQASIAESNPVVIMLHAYDQKIMLLNGGPMFTKNPSVSLMINCISEEEVQTLWNKLSLGGTVRMPLDTYAWSKKYGWVEDKYGMNWQLYLGEQMAVQKIVPTLMFTGISNGKAMEAMELYTSIFPSSEIQGVLKYPEGSGADEGNVQHAQFTIQKYLMYCMDSSFDHGFTFNEGASITVICENQQETDAYWNALTANGGEESMCGWLKDKFGLSWQIVPQQLLELLQDSDAAVAAKAQAEMLKMKKIIIADLT